MRVVRFITNWSIIFLSPFLVFVLGVFHIAIFIKESFEHPSVHRALKGEIFIWNDG